MICRVVQEEVFWKYTGELYARQGVSQSCLTLQDQLGLNVNLLLLLCWCEQRQLQLSREQIEQLTQAIEQWHRDYTKPLRQLRRTLALDDQATPELKRAIFDAEMALEKSEQRLLLGVFNRFKFVNNGTDERAQNIQSYVGLVQPTAVLTHAGLIEQLRTALSA